MPLAFLLLAERVVLLLGHLVQLLDVVSFQVDLVVLVLFGASGCFVVLVLHQFHYIYYIKSHPVVESFSVYLALLAH
jgi:hypothetical protein